MVGLTIDICNGEAQVLELSVLIPDKAITHDSVFFNTQA